MVQGPNHNSFNIYLWKYFIGKKCVYASHGHGENVSTGLITVGVTAPLSEHCAA